MAESINVGLPTRSLNVVSKDVVIFIQLSTSIPRLCKIGLQGGDYKGHAL
jgi:hypothetical protein